jgi:hypothetical protein
MSKPRLADKADTKTEPSKLGEILNEAAGNAPPSAAAPLTPTPAKSGVAGAPTILQAPAPAPPATVTLLDTKATRKIHPSRVHIDQNAHNTWAIHPEHGTTFEDILDPAYWAHVAESRLRPNDTIIVYPADNSYRATLAVRRAGRLFANVAVLSKTDFEALEMDAALKFTVDFRDPQTKWAVVRTSDKSVMQGGFDTQEAAMQWLGVNARTLAA